MVSNTNPEKGAHIVALAIHGGAGTTTRAMPTDLIQAYRDRLRAVLATTFNANHTTSLEAVCHAVSLLEDSPLFNAGKGAVFDLAGNTVCECSLMTTQPGFNSKTVAVTGVRRTKNPILLNKVLLEKNKDLGGHAFYSGRDAEEAGWKHGTEKVGYKYYYTKRRWNEHKRGMDSRLEKLASELVKAHGGHGDEGEVELPAYTTNHTTSGNQGTTEHEDQAIFDRYADLSDYLPQGTVGAVALDSNGHLSVATSTGGKTNKYPGRIGDTPSVGTGYLADTWTSSTRLHRHQPHSSPFLRLVHRVFSPKSWSKAKDTKRSDEGIAISGTGDGDFFLGTTFASTVAHRIKFGGASFPASIKAAMDELVTNYGGKGVGGAIILDKAGNAYFPLAANTMNRGLISLHTNFKPRVAIFDDEELV